MERRQFLQLAGAGAAALAIPRLSWAKAKSVSAATPGEEGAALDGAWRTVEVTTSLRRHTSAPAQLWLPVPLEKTSYQENLGTLWHGNFSRAGLLKDEEFGTPVFYADWETAGPIELIATYRVRTRDRAGVEKADPREAREFLKGSHHVPVDGLVKAQAARIVGHERDGDHKAARIYQWMVENTRREKAVRGCGTGDVDALLKSGKLAGKCADLSSLFVALCRASGVPAREVFGLRVLPSRLSKSIGKENDVTGAQHCRAEYYSERRRGWVPADPADVRKVILEENETIHDAHVVSLRRKLFGFWEMNWIAFNSARDFKLPPAPGVEVNYLMYPYFVSGGSAIDGFDAQELGYSIQAKLV